MALPAGDSRVVELFLGGMSRDLDSNGPANRPGELFYGQVRIGVMAPKARALYEELFVTGHGSRTKPAYRLAEAFHDARLSSDP